LVNAEWRIERRDFLRVSALSLLGLTTNGCRTPNAANPARVGLRFGLITDSHYAEADARGSRFYRESLGKVREAVDRLRAEQVDFLAVLGDLKDMVAGESEAQTRSHLVAIEAEVQRFAGPTYHVLGNHDMDNLSKADVLAQLENTGIGSNRSYYAFSRGGVRFIVLDATYDQHHRDYDRGKFDWRDANVPPPQLAWLGTELATTREPVVVLVHQRLDGDGATSISNREVVRSRVEASGKVIAVFQGHEHPGAYSLIRGIHYYTLRAVIEGSGETNNAYAIVEITAGLDLVITGYRRAVGMKLARGAAT